MDEELMPPPRVGQFNLVQDSKLNVSEDSIVDRKRRPKKQASQRPRGRSNKGSHTTHNNKSSSNQSYSKGKNGNRSKLRGEDGVQVRVVKSERGQRGVKPENLRSKSGKKQKSRGTRRPPRVELAEIDPQLKALSGDQLSGKFNEAVMHMRKAQIVVAPEEMLLLYGLYKQATSGDCRTKKPSPTSFVSYQKWIAWKSRESTGAETCMRLYIHNCTRLDPAFKSTTDPGELIRLASTNTVKQDVSDYDFDGIKEVPLDTQEKKPPSKDFNRFLASGALSFRAGAPLVPQRLSNDIKVESHKSLISEYDVRRFTMLQMQKQRLTVRYSSTQSAAPVTINIPQVDPKDPYKMIQHVIDIVCTEVNNKTLNAQTKDTFSGTTKPGVSLRDFVFRLVRYLDKWFNETPSMGSVGARSLLISTEYLNRIQKRVGDDFSITVYNVHRLFAVCMLLAAKFSEDYIIANSYWAEVAGINMAELNSIEEDFCTLCGFDFYISDALLGSLYDKYTLVV